MRNINPEPLTSVLLSSAVGGAAMQVGAALASKMLEGDSSKKSNPSLPNPLGNLPAKATRMWEHVYESAQERGFSKAASAAQAWCAVKRQYYKKGNRWLKRKEPLGRDEYPPGCAPYKQNPVVEAESPVLVVAYLLETLRMAYDVYREAHWRVAGSEAYGKHLLFERLYEEAQEQVDLVAEMAVGTFGNGFLSDIGDWRSVRAEYVAGMVQLPPIDAGLNVVAQIDDVIMACYESLDDHALLTPGWDNLLGGISQINTQHKYLLQQSQKQTRSLKHKLLK